jgi:hypothetical protein
MGPNKEYSIQRAEEAFEEIMYLLQDKYDATRPGSDEWNMFASFREDWDTAEKQLKEALVELIWTSDANNW